MLILVDVDWMEKGVYDALQKKYLRALLFCICETIEGLMIAEYLFVQSSSHQMEANTVKKFSFSYPNPDSQQVYMNFNRTGSKEKGGELMRLYNWSYSKSNEVHCL